MASIICSPDGVEISKRSTELQGLIIQHVKMELSYENVFPKVSTKLVHDLLVRRKDPGYPHMYIVEVFTKKGTDSQACKEHILATTGMAPSIDDNGTHYVTHMRLTLEILKKLNDFEFVVEVTGDCTNTDIFRTNSQEWRRTYY